jgi:hypothetical protein
MQKQSSLLLIKLIMFFQIQMRDHFMIAIDKKYYSTNKTCLKRIYKCTALDSIFFHILQSVALKDFKIKKEVFIRFTEKFFKKLKLKKPNHIACETICNNNLGNIKV